MSDLVSIIQVLFNWIQSITTTLSPLNFSNEVTSLVSTTSATASSTGLSKPIWVWVIFHLIVFFLLALDLGIGQRKLHSPTFKEALSWAVFYIFAALLYGVWIYFEYGKNNSILYLTGFLVEKSLAVDNLFVFLVLFTYFAVPSDLRHYVLFFGIVGALIFRGIFIAIGAILIAKFSWILYVFGVFLILTAYKLIRAGDHEIHPESNPVIRWLQKRIPMVSQYVGKKFFIRENGKLLFTPLFLVLIYIEITDIIFAVDSIPAIFAITSDPFLVYTSNVFAILGLRSLYFVLDRVLPMFRFLKPALAVILAFIGTKMLIHGWLHIAPLVSLIVVVGILALAIMMSIWMKKPQTPEKT